MPSRHSSPASVPAVATWMPFDGSIAKSSPDAVKLADASQFADAAILNGWSASNELYAGNKELLRRFIRAWLPANEALVTRPQELLTDPPAGALQGVHAGAAAKPV